MREELTKNIIKYTKNTVTPANKLASIFNYCKPDFKTHTRYCFTSSYYYKI